MLTNRMDSPPEKILWDTTYVVSFINSLNSEFYNDHDSLGGLLTECGGRCSWRPGGLDSVCRALIHICVAQGRWREATQRRSTVGKAEMRHPESIYQHHPISASFTVSICNV
jgi:hypothetical protein